LDFPHAVEAYLETLLEWEESPSPSPSVPAAEARSAAWYDFHAKFEEKHER